LTAEPTPPGGRRLWGVCPEARGERTQARDEPEGAALVIGVGRRGKEVHPAARGRVCGRVASSPEETKYGQARIALRVGWLPVQLRLVSDIAAEEPLSLIGLYVLGGRTIEAPLKVLRA
jgi:hypothetical protein